MRTRTVVPAALAAVTLTVSSAFAQSAYRDAVLASAPTGYWRFEETSGPMLNEVSSGPAGAPEGTIDRSQPSASPELGNSLRFTFGSVTIPYYEGLAHETEYTVELWMRRDPSLTTFGFALSSGNDLANGSMKFVMRPTEPDCTLIMANGQFASVGWYPYQAAQTLEWHHYAFVYSRAGEYCRLFVDGVIVDQKPIRVPFATNTRPLVIGKHDNNGAYRYPYVGWIDEVAVFDRALDAAEIRSHVCAAEIADGICCRADLNKDGTTNGGDLGILLGFWGTGAELYPPSDIDGNGLVDGADLTLLLASWVHCPG